MTLFTAAERDFLTAISRLAYCNPFLPERIDLEREALGSEFTDEGTDVWSKNAEWDRERPNIAQLTGRSELIAAAIQKKLLAEKSIPTRDLVLYEDVVLYVLYYRYWEELNGLVAAAGASSKPLTCWNKFRTDFDHFLRPGGNNLSSDLDAEHMFACLFQLRRAFHHIFHFVLGRSAAAVKLRVAIWQSIFTHDMRRYRRSLFRHMGDIATLITGPSGTGKELVARAIGLSRYIPFDAKRGQFVADFATTFHPLHLAAMSTTLIESELFGHRRGSFTGAIDDHTGRLDSCGPHGSVFLDEIGEVCGEVQVKLLRVLQTREFQRVGENETRRFAGKVIAATNCDLAEEMEAGRFRQDFYYRLCADTVGTPSLRTQLDDRPDDLPNLVRFLACRVAGDEGNQLTREVIQWIENHLGPSYPWPGNFRELEQCVRNVMIHGEYRPPARQGGDSTDSQAAIIRGTQDGSLTADELLQHYCTLMYARTGSYEKTAKLIQLDRRTVKSKIDKRDSTESASDSEST